MDRPTETSFLFDRSCITKVTLYVNTHTLIVSVFGNVNIVCVATKITQQMWSAAKKPLILWQLRPVSFLLPSLSANIK